MKYINYTDKSSLDVKRGRYNKGGTTDILPTRLGWWERDLSFMDRQIDDISFEITNLEEYRADLISYKVYGRPDYEWLVLQYNNIIDINEELIAGKWLVLPSQDRANFDITL